MTSLLIVKNYLKFKIFEPYKPFKLLAFKYKKKTHRLTIQEDLASKMPCPTPTIGQSFGRRGWRCS
jgi:hypothetical protein